MPPKQLPTLPPLPTLRAVTPILIICILCAFAYFAKGVTGAASAIVFNAGVLSALALGVAGGLSLLDALYWIALADVFANLILAFILRRELRLEKLTVLVIVGMAPLVVLFAALLPVFNLYWLTLVLAVAVTGGGIYLAMRKDLPPANPRTLVRWALPTGAAAGVLGGLFGMGGPVIFILLSRASDHPSVFRRRALLITIAAAATRLVTLILTGAIGTLHLEWFLVAAPVIVASLFAGIYVHHKVRPRPFRLILGGLVMLAGLGGLLRFALL